MIQRDGYVVSHVTERMNAAFTYTDEKMVMTTFTTVMTSHAKRLETQ